MRLAPLFITAGLAAILAGCFLETGVAQAAAMDPKDVTRLLARSLTLDKRCHFLADADSQNLRDLVARAEISLAAKYSVNIAKQQLANGRAEGQAAACNDQNKLEAQTIVKAGMAAVGQTALAPEQEPVQSSPSQAAPQQQATAPAPAEPKALPTGPKPQIAIVDPPKAKTAPVVVPRVVKKRQAVVAVVPGPKRNTRQIRVVKGTVLTSYASLAERYYVELRCRAMPLGSARRMYDDVLSQHQNAMATQGPAAVRRVLTQARLRAEAKSCS